MVKDMRTRQHPSPELKSLMALQSDQATIAQAVAFGLSEKAVRRLVVEGAWERTAGGVYTSRPGTSDLGKRAWAGHLAIGEGSALGGEAALALAGLAREVVDIELWVPPDCQRRSAGFLVHRDHLQRLAHARGTLPVIRPVDALVDVGQHLPIEELVGLIAEAVRTGRTSLKQLSATLDDRPRIHMRRRFAELVGDMKGIESTLEYAYRRDVERSHQLPKAKRAVSVSARTRSDVLYDGYGLLVELDGRVGHIDGAFRDLRRDNVHATSGFVTLRYGSVDVRGKPCQVAAALASRGWPGPFVRCPLCSWASDSDFSA
jgi:very-short-patch-repair endonuclease